MAAIETKRPITTHTEYSHSQFRSLGCGETVPVEEEKHERRLCTGCTPAVSE